MIRRGPLQKTQFLDGIEAFLLGLGSAVDCLPAIESFAFRGFVPLMEGLAVVFGLVLVLVSLTASFVCDL